VINDVSLSVNYLFCKIILYLDSESCAGFGFVQYLQHSVAVKARNSLNMTELNGRKIAIDWAIPKDEYETAIHDG
jgi:nucleolar protein 4